MPIMEVDFGETCCDLECPNRLGKVLSSQEIQQQLQLVMSMMEVDFQETYCNLKCRSEWGKYIKAACSTTQNRYLNLFHLIHEFLLQYQNYLFMKLASQTLVGLRGPP